MDHVFGYTCVCDVTARDLQKKDGQWTRAEVRYLLSCGPWIETAVDPSALRVRCEVNGVTVERQHVPDGLRRGRAHRLHQAKVMTLEPGDLIVTGTPEGTGPLVQGDDVVVEVSEVGALRFSVRAAP